MPKKEEKGTEPVLEPEPAPEPEPELTPTPEEQLTALQKELDDTKSQRDEYKKGLDTSHASHREKDKEIRRQADLDTRIDGLEGTLEAFGGLLSDRLNVSDEELTEKKVDYRKVFKDEIAEQRKQRSEANRIVQQNEYAATAQAIYAKGQEAFKDDPASLSMVAMNLDAGRTDLAEALIAKAEKPTDTKEKNVESEEDKIERLAEEKYKKRLDDEGLLHTESALPSGRSKTMNEIAAKVASGDMSIEEAQKAGFDFS